MTARLTQLSGLDFSAAVVDVRRISALDAVGIASILRSSNRSSKPVAPFTSSIPTSTSATWSTPGIGTIHTAEPPNGKGGDDPTGVSAPCAWPVCVDG